MTLILGSEELPEWLIRMFGAGKLGEESGVKSLVMTYMGPMFPAHGPVKMEISEVAVFFNG